MISGHLSPLNRGYYLTLPNLHCTYDFEEIPPNCHTFQVGSPQKCVPFNAALLNLNEFPEFPEFPQHGESKRSLVPQRSTTPRSEVFFTRKSGWGFLENPCKLWVKLGKNLVNYGINSEKSSDKLI